MSKRRTIRPKEAYHHGDLRRQLLQATRQLITRHGAEQFKVADACKLAGVSIAAPYRHFDSRDDLLDQVVIEGLSEMKDRLTDAVTTLERGSVQALAALGVAYVEFARREPNLFRLMFKPVDDPERHERIECCGSETYGVLLNEVARALNKDTVDEQVLEMALPMWTFVHGTAVLLIDDMLDVTQVTINVEQMVVSVCTRLMSPAAVTPPSPPPGGFQ